MSETWYRVSQWGCVPKIEEVEVFRSTARCIYPLTPQGTQGPREAQHTEWREYFSIRDQAVGFVVGVLNRRIDHAKDAHRNAIGGLANFLSAEERRRNEED